MQKVLTAEQMRTVDRLTTERYGIPSILLMENAAHAVARVITKKLGGSVMGKSILILCGPGNNGGDGAALARVLWEQDVDVYLIVVGKIADTKGDAQLNFEFLRMLVDNDPQFIDFWEIQEFSEFHELQEKFLANKGVDLIVDALFGIGLTRPLDIPFDQLVHSFSNWILHRKKIPVLSIDLPSGLDADRSDSIGSKVLADYTVTFTASKTANILPPASNFNGELVVASIGSPPELVERQPSQFFLAEHSDARFWLIKTRFSDASYKNKRSHALIVAGSNDYSGAAVLCGNSAMRSGVGFVTICVPDSCKTEIASRVLPEVIVRTIGGDADVIEGADAIAVGCGLSATDGNIEKLVREVVEQRKVPVIVDAGALWFFNPPAGVPTTRDGQPPLILTPHEGEFLRLLGTDNKEAIKDRVAAVRKFAIKNNVILVLKGERVLIGAPDGPVVVNPTGNSGLGKAGNGDTLTGILGGFTAQAAKMNIDIFETVVAAVYIAGMAGDIAEQKYGKRVMTASDVRECLSEVFAELENN